MQQNKVVGHFSVNQPGVIRTKMSDALLKGLADANTRGHNPGKVGRHIITAASAGIGVKYMPGKKKTQKVAA